MATNSPVRRRPVPAVARALAILRLLGDSEHALGVQTIARETGMVPSTGLHILRELAEENLVAFDDSTKRYTLDAGILALVDKMLRRKPLAHTVQPSLDRLTRRFSISACLMQISGAGHMVVIGVSNRADLGVKIDLGTLVPVLASAT